MHYVILDWKKVTSVCPFQIQTQNLCCPINRYIYLYYESCSFSACCHLQCSDCSLQEPWDGRFNSAEGVPLTVIRYLQFVIIETYSSKCEVSYCWQRRIRTETYRLNYTYIGCFKVCLVTDWGSLDSHFSEVKSWKKNPFQLYFADGQNPSVYQYKTEALGCIINPK